MKSLYGIFKGISGRFFGPSALHLCFYEPSVRQIARTWLAQTDLSVKLFSQGIIVQTHICISTRTHTVNPKSKHYFLLVIWILIVKFVSLAPDTHLPALSKPGDDRQALRVTAFYSRELCLCECVCVFPFQKHILVPQGVISEHTGELIN